MLFIMGYHIERLTRILKGNCILFINITSIKQFKHILSIVLKNILIAISPLHSSNDPTRKLMVNVLL